MEDNRNSIDKNKEEQTITPVEKNDLLKIILHVWVIRKTLIRAAICGAVLGLIISFLIPKQFEVSVTLSPELGDSRIKGNGLMSLASSLLGGTEQRSGENLNVMLAPQIVSSTPFLLEMLDARVVSEDVDTTLSVYLGTESKSLLGNIMGFPARTLKGIKSLFADEKKEPTVLHQNESIISINEGQEAKLSALRNKISSFVDKKLGIITLSVRLKDPVITATVADSLITKLQKYFIKYKTSKAKEDCGYWEKLYQESQQKYYLAQKNYAEYIDANTNIVFQSTLVERERLQNEVTLAFQGFSQVAQQLQLAQAKVQQQKPAFTIVEPSVVPLRRVGTSKVFIILAFSFLSVFLVGGWKILFKNLFIKLKLQLSN